MNSRLHRDPINHVARRPRGLGTRPLTVLILMLLVLEQSTWLRGATGLTITRKVDAVVGDRLDGFLPPDHAIRSAHVMRNRDLLVVLAPERGPGFKWMRLDAAGGIVWSNAFAFGESEKIAELPSGEIAYLDNDTFRNHLKVVGADGVQVRDVEIPLPAPTGHSGGGPNAELIYSSLLGMTNGLLVAGSVYFEGTIEANFVMLLDRQSFQKVWQREYGVFRYGQRPLAHLVQGTAGGYVFAYNGWIHPATNPSFSEWHMFVSVDAEGEIKWRRQIFPDSTRNDWAPIVGMSVTQVAAGGSLLGFTSDYQAESAPHYGQKDVWLLRLDGSGNKLWDRSYGGLGTEEIGGVVSTDDGGFLVIAWTRGSQVSGNKTVDGNGVWLLKLDGQGMLESQTMLREDLANAPRVLTTSQGLLLTYRPSALPPTSWIRPIGIRRAVEVKIAPLDRPHDVDVSSNLMDWTRVISGFRGDLNFRESLDGAQKFYRISESRR